MFYFECFSLSKILITFCSAMTSKFEVISSQTNISGCAKRERIIFNFVVAHHLPLEETLLLDL